MDVTQHRVIWHQSSLQTSPDRGEVEKGQASSEWMGMRVRSCGVYIAHGGSRFRNSCETIAFPTDSEAPSLCGAEKIAHQKLHPEGFGPSLGTPIQVLRGGGFARIRVRSLNRKEYWATSERNDIYSSHSQDCFRNLLRAPNGWSARERPAAPQPTPLRLRCEHRLARYFQCMHAMLTQEYPVDRPSPGNRVSRTNSAWHLR